MGLTILFLGPVVITGQSPLPLDAAAAGYPIRGVVGDGTVSNSTTSETARQVLPWFAAGKQALLSGHLPLWNRHSLSGHPLLGYSQSAPFSPFFLSTIFVPLPRQMVAMAALKLFCGLLFGCLLMRREGIGWWVSILGSMIFALSLYEVVFLYYPMTSVTALLPALLYSVSRMLDRAGRASIVLLGLVTAGMMTGGHPESAFHSAIAAVGWLLLEAVAPRHQADWRSVVKATTIAVIVGVLLSSPAWLPVVEQIPKSMRNAETVHTERSGHTPRLEIHATALLLDPNHFGHPSRQNWSHRSNYAELASLYIGLIPLAILMAAVPSRRSARRDRLLIVGWAICLLIAFDWTPIAQLINSTLPFSLVANARLRFVATLLAAVASARYLHRLDRRDLGWLALSTSVVIIGWIVVGQSRVEEQASYLGPAALLGLWVAIALRFVPRFSRISVAAVAIPVFFLELAVLNSSFHPPRDEKLFAPKLPIMGTIRTHSAEAGPFRVVGRNWTLLPDLATHYGLEDIRGVDPLALASYVDILDSTAPRHPRWRHVWLIRDFNQPILDFLNVRYVLTEPGKRAHRRFEHLYSGPDGELFFNPRAQPRFFVPRRLKERDAIDLVDNLAQIGNLGRTALVESIDFGSVRRNAKATITKIEDDGFGRFRLVTIAGAPTLIASSLPNVPGWRLRLNGEPATMEEVNGAFVGFTVPAGHTEVNLHYHPRSFDFGLVLALIGMITLVVVSTSKHD